MAFVPEIHRSSVDLGNESQDCWGITLRVTESPDCFFCWMMLDGLTRPWNNSNQTLDSSALGLVFHSQ